MKKLLTAIFCLLSAYPFSYCQNNNIVEYTPNYFYGNSNFTPSKSYVETDSVKYILEIQFGAFPKMNNKSFVSAGYGTMLSYEKEYMTSRFAGGWYLSYRKAFAPLEMPGNNINSSVSIGRYFLIMSLLNDSTSRIKLKLGLGLGYLEPGIFTIVAISSNAGAYYTFSIKNGIKCTTSISTEIIGSKIFPIIFSLGLTF